jgi:predicted dehydrogenase
MSHLNRRKFLKTVAAAATVTIAGTKSSGRVLGSNSAIRIAVAGLNGRGSAHVGAYATMPGVHVTYLIDPDLRTYRPRVKQLVRAGHTTLPQMVQDVRVALQDRNLDAISIATPNHWHALMTIWSAQAGKHVYVEKPSSHNVHEGRVTVDVARRNNVIVQHGTQSRSDTRWAEVVEVIRSGQLGRLLVARALCYKTRNTINTRPNSAPPAELDFNLWLGPAPQQPHHANLVHYNWHWFWDFGNGDIGNQGVHQMDIARWGIPGATLPRSVISVGGRFGYTDQGQTPNTQISVMDFGQTQLIFEVRGLRTGPFHGQGVGNIFHLEEGTIAGSQFYPRGRTTPAPLPRPQNPVARGPGGSNHFGNFIAAVRSRRTQDLNADILEGHYSSALCHLANVSYRLGEQVPFNGRTRAFGDNREAAETFARMEEHLRENRVPLDGQTYRVGRRLTLDVPNERFSNDAEANRLLTREYRQPFVVPERA